MKENKLYFQKRKTNNKKNRFVIQQIFNNLEMFLKIEKKK